MHLYSLLTCRGALGKTVLPIYVLGAMVVGGRCGGHEVSWVMISRYEWAVSHNVCAGLALSLKINTLK